MRHVEAWVRAWELPDIYAGVPGRGADSAWHMHALDLERAHIHNTHSSHGALDLFKCVDQINRALVYLILLRGGFQPRLLVAYKNAQEHLLVHNSCHEAIGNAYH